MMDISLEKAQKLKTELDIAIMDLLVEFKEDTGLCVEGVDLTISREEGSQKTELTVVEVKTVVKITP